MKGYTKPKLTDFGWGVISGLGNIGVQSVGAAINKDGNKSPAGNVLNTLGSLGMALPGPYKFVGVGLNALGVATDALWGHKTNAANVAAMDNRLAT
jgi:hypothetical protein